jgi:predicted nucleotidyltransferase
MPLDLPIDRQQLESICRRYHVAKLELFGSRARGEGHPGSDVDLLVTFEEGFNPGLEFFGFANELEELFGTSFDLLTRRVVEADPNPYFREGILTDVEALYAA